MYFFPKNKPNAPSQFSRLQSDSHFEKGKGIWGMGGKKKSAELFDEDSA
jgi:hypothetical protein